MERYQPAALGPKAGPFVAATRSGSLLLVSGQVARNADGSVHGVGDTVAQAEKIFENMAIVLASAGATFADVLKVTIYLTERADREALATVRRRTFGATEPASTLIWVPRLGHADFLLEIEAIAEVP